MVYIPDNNIIWVTLELVENQANIEYFSKKELKQSEFRKIHLLNE